MLSYLLSKPDDWTILPAQLAKVGRIGRRSTYRIINELIDSGWLRRQQSRDGTRFAKGEYLVCDEPDRRCATTEKSPCDRFEHAGNEHAQKGTTTKNGKTLRTDPDQIPAKRETFGRVEPCTDRGRLRHREVGARATHGQANGYGSRPFSRRVLQ
jgi:hypothetical protein